DRGKGRVSAHSRCGDRSMTVRNADRLVKKLSMLPSRLTRPVEGALLASAAEMNNHAIIRIQKNSGTGRVYRRGGRVHVGSSPGEYPNTDTGELVRNMYFRLVAPFVAHWGNTAKHALPLEKGTSRMAARPFVRPTFLALIDKAKDRVGKAV